MTLWWAVVNATFQTVKVKINGRNYIFGVRCQITWRPSLFPFGSLDEHVIPIGPILFEGLREIYWSLDGVIMNNIWEFYKTIWRSLQ